MRAPVPFCAPEDPPTARDLDAQEIIRAFHEIVGENSDPASEQWEQYRALVLEKNQRHKLQDELDFSWTKKELEAGGFDAENQSRMTENSILPPIRVAKSKPISRTLSANASLSSSLASRAHEARLRKSRHGSV